MSNAENLARVARSVITDANNNVAITGKMSAAFIETSQLITENHTISTGSNAISAGPIEIAVGVYVDVPVGSTWVIV